MEQCLNYGPLFASKVSSLLRKKVFSMTFNSKITPSWNGNTLKNALVFQTLCIPFVSANETICKNTYFDNSYSSK